jgi:hypothetical protein
MVLVTDCRSWTFGLFTPGERSLGMFWVGACAGPRADLRPTHVLVTGLTVLIPILYKAEAKPCLIQTSCTEEVRRI